MLLAVDVGNTNTVFALYRARTPLGHNAIAAELARRSPETPQTLRAQVTSKGGTTHAAITSLEADGVKAAFVRALRAAERRAQELGDEFGPAQEAAWTRATNLITELMLSS